MRPSITLLAIAVILAGCSQGGEADAPVTGESAGDAAADGDSATLASLTGDAAQGEQLFRQCAACHAVEPGANRIGPSLHDIVGRDAGTLAGFSFSDAMRTSGLSWTPDTLFAFLENPRASMPTTRMAYAGMRDAQDRADLIAYLETL